MQKIKNLDTSMRINQTSETQNNLSKYYSSLKK
jgi:hypothetical protein